MIFKKHVLGGFFFFLNCSLFKIDYYPIHNHVALDYDVYVLLFLFLHAKDQSTISFSEKTKQKLPVVFDFKETTALTCCDIYMNKLFPPSCVY